MAFSLLEIKTVGLLVQSLLVWEALDLIVCCEANSLHSV